MTHLIEDHIQEAIEVVQAWDLPEEQFAEAVTNQARLMAGIDLDYRDTGLEIRLHTTLRF
jgi:hypothetical protein